MSTSVEPSLYTYSAVTNMARAMSGAQSDIGVAAFMVYRGLQQLLTTSMSIDDLLSDLLLQSTSDTISPHAKQVYGLFYHAVYYMEPPSSKRR